MPADRDEKPRVLWLAATPTADSLRVARPETLGELVAEFLAWMGREVREGRYAQNTLNFYSYPLTRFANFAGPMLPLSELIPYHLERFKTNWHSVVAVQRLAKWAADNGLLPRSPFAGVAKPPKGQRERVLTRPELLRLMRGARPHLRRFLIAMLHTIARPQEIRALRWSQLVEVGGGARAFVLTDFKGKKRRRDGMKVRVVAVDARMGRLLGRLRRRWAERPLWDHAADHVFLNSRGGPLSANTVRCCMRRLRVKCGLAAEGEEKIVAYSFRHTAATIAVANGIRDRVLADLMGHAQPSMTQKYIHLQPSHLTDAIREATKQ